MSALTHREPVRGRERCRGGGAVHGWAGASSWGGAHRLGSMFCTPEQGEDRLIGSLCGQLLACRVRSNRAPVRTHEARQTGCEVHGTGRGTDGRMGGVYRIRQRPAGGKSVSASDEHSNGWAAQPQWRVQAPAQQRASGGLAPPRSQDRSAPSRDDFHRRQRR